MCVHSKRHRRNHVVVIVVATTTWSSWCFLQSIKLDDQTCTHTPMCHSLPSGERHLQWKSKQHRIIFSSYYTQLKHRDTTLPGSQRVGFAWIAAKCKDATRKTFALFFTIVGVVDFVSRHSTRDSKNSSLSFLIDLGGSPNWPTELGTGLIASLSLSLSVWLQWIIIQPKGHEFIHISLYPLRLHRRPVWLYRRMTTHSTHSRTTVSASTRHDWTIITGLINTVGLMS